tara:strand:- start:614 stop:1396 length:783 start_codon:yes stop_codon:yes gene_type:complete
MFKKTAIAALVLGFSGAASAAMYAPAPAPSCAAGNVTVPCERSAWDLGIDALYMRADDNAFSTIANAGFRAKYGWGFRLEGSYHFGTGNDTTVNWSHNKRTTDQTVGTTALSLENNLDIVNFELGQVVNFGESVSARFQGGVQYVSIKDDATTAGTAVTRKTTAFGPRAGLMSKYDFGNGFGVYGDVNAAMLVGKAVVAAGNVYGTMVSTDSNVGVSYTHAMAQGDLTTRLAWGVKQMNLGSTVNGFDGITLGLKWVGNA